MTTFGVMRERILERPFRPFRIYLSDGRQYDIHDPFWNLVAEAVMRVGVAPEDDPRSPVPDRHESVDYHLIERVELLPTANAKT